MTAGDGLSRRYVLRGGIGGALAMAITYGIGRLIGGAL